MGGQQQFGLVLTAAAGGLVCGHLRQRGDRRVTASALVQAAEWFVGYGAAAAVLSAAHQILEQAASGNAQNGEFELERVTRICQSVTERTGTDG
jgi:hypothetical protein